MDDSFEVVLGSRETSDIPDIQSTGRIEMNSNVIGDNREKCSNRPEPGREDCSTGLSPNARKSGESESGKESLNTDEVSNLTASSELNGNDTLKPNNNSLSAECEEVTPAEMDLEPKVTAKSPAIDMMAMLIDAAATDDALVISNANARPLSQNITNKASGSLLLLSQYGSDESLDEEEVPPASNLNYREDNNTIPESDKDSDSDSSSSSSSSSVFISDSSDTESDVENENKKLKPKAVKAKGELELNDLPPIEDLKISVPVEECTAIGKIFQIVDVLVVVQAFKNSPAYDVDTVLFLDGGLPLGKIFEVFGPVCEPHYCIRFNSQEHIKERNIALEQMVYSAPKKTEFTKFVFLSQLMKMKGTDASWVDDFETPESFQDYSDDEQERMAKRNKLRSGKAAPRVDSDPEEPARKKHFAYEKKMNERNLQLSTISNRRFNNNQQSFMDSPSPGCSSAGLRNSSPRFREFIRHRFGSVPSFGPGMFNNFFPSGPRISDSSFIHNFQPNTPNPGASHSPNAFMPQWSSISGPYVDPRSQPFSPPMSGPYIQNECHRPSVQVPPHNWGLPPMRPPMPNIPPIGTHPLMTRPPANMPPLNTHPPNLPSMATPPPNMPHPSNIPLMGTPPPNMPPMSTPPPLPSNFIWSPNRFFSNHHTPTTTQRNLIRPSSLPPPPDWSFHLK